MEKHDGHGRAQREQLPSNPTAAAAAAKDQFASEVARLQAAVQAQEAALRTQQRSTTTSNHLKRTLTDNAATTARKRHNAAQHTDTFLREVLSTAAPGAYSTTKPLWQALPGTSSKASAYTLPCAELRTAPLAILMGAYESPLRRTCATWALHADKHLSTRLANHQARAQLLRATLCAHANWPTCPFALRGTCKATATCLCVDSCAHINAQPFLKRTLLGFRWNAMPMAVNA